MYVTFSIFRLLVPVTNETRSKLPTPLVTNWWPTDWPTWPSRDGEKKIRYCTKKQVSTGDLVKIFGKKILHNFIWARFISLYIFCDLHSELIQFDSLREGEIESISNHIFWLCLRNMDEKSTKSTFGFNDAYTSFLPYVFNTKIIVHSKKG